MKSMSERFTCPQGHQWDDAHWTGTQRNLCPYCGAEPASPTAIASAEAPRAQPKPARADEDLPSVLAAELSVPARPKTKRGVGSVAVLGCLFVILAIGALVAGGGGWYYHSARQFELLRARAVVEKSLNDEYQNHWQIDSESISPLLTEAVFEGKGTPGGFAQAQRKFTIVVSKQDDGRWRIDH
jgi:hypothetical protein